MGEYYTDDPQGSRTHFGKLSGGIMQEFVERIAMCVSRGKVNRAAPYPPDMKGQDGADELAADAVKNGIPPGVLLEGCMLGMDKIGKEFSEKKAAVTNLVISAAAMNAVLKHIKPFLESGEVKRRGTFVIGTVSGDLHDIGKNLVSMIVTGGGFEVIDLGVDVPTSKFLSTLAQHPGCVVGLSALLTITMPSMEKSVRAIKEAYPDIKVMVGGAPITGDFCARIGADFTSHNPHEAVEYLNKNVT
jgi:5-methyltetrahydrofolate--homocysteine methyltransferase